MCLEKIARISGWLRGEGGSPRHPDAQSAGNGPAGKAPRHSASPQDVKPERQMSNLADVMGVL
eukprot:1321852-Pyramimonas_sp.AAC.1